MKHEISDQDTLILHTKKWIKEVVIGLNFCPFAKAPFEKNTIHYGVCHPDRKLKEQLSFLRSELEFLEREQEVETSILIYPKYTENFFEYLDFVDRAGELIQNNEYDGIYQLATFHPEYIFEGSEESDPANYTNRSPYPLLHLIRESSIDLALKNYKKPENIPEANIRVARELGISTLQKMLSHSKQ